MKAGRKHRVRLALNAYARAAKQDAEPVETNVVDLLADLLHLYAADPRAVSLAEHPEPDAESWLYGVVAKAAGHYTAEERGEI